MSNEFLQLLATLGEKVEAGVRKWTFPDLMLNSEEWCDSVEVEDNTCKINLGVTGHMVLEKEMKMSKKRWWTRSTEASINSWVADS